LKKSKYLRAVNLLGLSVIFSCLSLSFAHIKKELGYDRFHEKTDRIVRFSVQMNGEPAKGNPLTAGIPGIEDVLLMQQLETGLLTKDGRPEIVNNIFFAGANFFEVFSFPLLEGEKSTVLDAPGKVVISKTYAQRFFGEEPAVGKEVKLSGRRFDEADGTYFISEFPE
jgi:putative ABC transport system permease protein